MVTCHHSIHSTTTGYSQSFRGPEEGSNWPKTTQQVRQLCLRWINPKLKPSKHPHFSDLKTKSVSELRLPTSRERQTRLLRFSLVWFPRACGEGHGKPWVSLLSRPLSCAIPAVFSQASSAPTPQGQREDREEAGVPRLPPTAPGSARMAKSHGFCPAHETHLTQNLFQLLQFLAAVEASLSDASASHTPPKRGEGAHTNNGAL